MEKFIPLLVFSLIYIGAVKLQIMLFTHWFKKKGKGKIQAYLFFTVFTFWFCFTGMIAQIIVYNKFEKKKTKLFKEVSAIPSDSNVDKLIDFLDHSIFDDKPNNWNQLRAVWFAVNESPDVTTTKKKQLKQFLMLQGLTIHRQDAEIIDNYGK